MKKTLEKLFTSEHTTFKHNYANYTLTVEVKIEKILNFYVLNNGIFQSLMNY